MAARMQLEQMRGRPALPPGIPGMVLPGAPGHLAQPGDGTNGTGQYL
jgi:hypothetical protein